MPANILVPDLKQKNTELDYGQNGPFTNSQKDGDTRTHYVQRKRRDSTSQKVRTSLRLPMRWIPRDIGLPPLAIRPSSGMRLVEPVPAPHRRVYR